MKKDIDINEHEIKSIYIWSLGQNLPQVQVKIYLKFRSKSTLSSGIGLLLLFFISRPQWGLHSFIDYWLQVFNELFVLSYRCFIVSFIKLFSLISRQSDLFLEELNMERYNKQIMNHRP